MNKDIIYQIQLTSKDALTVMNMFMFQNGRNHLSNYRHKNIFGNLDCMCNVAFKSWRKLPFPSKAVIYKIDYLFCLNLFLTRVLLDRKKHRGT